ncbi:hypothetical protein [Marinobacter nauticus]|uniref:hypothetical protein n=1 Tax=Marinobacter nauticus TaxID=2743 RepID=UPI0040444D07
MSEILNKLSSYNIFNYMLPGVVFSALITKTTEINLVYENLIIAPFIYYFTGMIISRVGSLFIEPAFKHIKLIQKESYDDYLLAKEKDPSIETISEQNNTYRTLCSTFFCILTIYGFIKILQLLEIEPTNLSPWYSLALFILFALSYRKQNDYIVKRIRNCKTPQ